ncbi:MAG: adenylosuccinate synthase [Pseudobdellovibrionaceae bacterium]|nr:MAG: adenylosuccinate synthase [Pseudobdellovibrionaceae bacterium]
MPGIVVVGSQWGDEGKGKVVDVFSAQSDMVVRYQGGANAGHTLIVDGQKTVLHLVPSGVLHPKTTCVIGSGVVLDVENLADEIRALKANGLLKDPSQLLISDGATVLLPYHRLLDQARENSLGLEKIGTTRKGIGPAYEDRAARKAILFGDLFGEVVGLKKKISESLKEKNFLLEKMYNEKPVDVDEVIEFVQKLAEELAPYRCKDTSLLVHKSLKAGKKVLFEGAQGSLLDLLHGTYPYVTSSSTIAGSACVGAGVGPRMVDKVIGITKAYTTRVGSGPFPTELTDEVGVRLRDVGREYGATTGRERRCGWLDLVALRYAIRINGITNIALMKLDVLSGLDEIKVCTAYELDGESITEYPVTPGSLGRVKPIYHTLKGWSEQVDEINSPHDLPRQAHEYVQFISEELGIPIDVISVGPGRNQTLWIKPLFN